MTVSDMSDRDAAGPALGETGPPSQGTGSSPARTGSLHEGAGSASEETGSASEETGSASGRIGTASEDAGSASKETGSASGRIGTASRETGSIPGKTGSASGEAGSALEETGSRSEETRSGSGEAGSRSAEAGSEEPGHAPGETGPIPGETHRERVNRELGELLQGLRVAATGVQVLFAFLLTLPFSAGFGRVDEFGRWLFYIAMLSAAVASICLITPAAQHRILFRSALKEKMLKRANELTLIGGVALAVSMACSTGLVVESFLGVWPAALLAAAVAGMSGWFWFLQPIIDRYRAEEEPVADG